MKTENNTGLGLIKTTIERVQASELFTSALKKLANSTDAELQKFLGDVKRALKNITLLCKIVILKVESFKVGDKFKHRAKKEIGIQMY
ncbi:hypothetical protein KKB58_01390, partial [Patescibacteria group bacterium]|nr:hypothetical protein [Patescibacteria group bacterium]